MISFASLRACCLTTFSYTLQLVFGMFLFGWSWTGSMESPGCAYPLRLWVAVQLGRLFVAFILYSWGSCLLYPHQRHAREVMRNLVYVLDLMNLFWVGMALAFVFYSSYSSANSCRSSPDMRILFVLLWIFIGFAIASFAIPLFVTIVIVLALPCPSLALRLAEHMVNNLHCFYDVDGMPRRSSPGRRYFVQ
jgi:hypothetical protein